MAVTLVYRDKKYQLNPGMTVRDAIIKVGLQPEVVLAVYEGKLITDDTILKDETTIKLVAVISGGTEDEGRRTEAISVVGRRSSVVSV